jgi:CheY-like chemotaxis protein
MKHHILFINENKDELLTFLEALKELPDKDGFKCTYADSPRRALDMLKHIVPDYIFFDMGMPGMDSLDFLTIIREEPNLKKAKIYLCSSEISEETYNSLMAAGATGWIQKAESIERLAIKLKIFIGMGPRPALR